VQLGRAIASQRGWWIALPCVLLLAAAVILPGLGTFGLWEPQERQLADKVAPGPELAAKDKAKPPIPEPPPPADGCYRQAPKDAVARSLGTRAPAWGRDAFGDSDAGRRLPFALLGILCVLATAGIAMRTVGARAGVIAAMVLLSMPLLVLQSRQLNSEIGTATGGALCIYGLLALGSLERVLVGAMLPLGIVASRPRMNVVTATIDGLIGALALAGGLAIGFLSGGGLLGVVVPVGAFAAAGALGIPTLIDLVRWGHNRELAIMRRVKPRWAIGRAEPWAYTRSPGNAIALLATVLAVIVLAALVYQMFALREPQPGLVPPQRALFGHAIVAPGCYSPALGGTWRPDDDLRYIYDSSFEQIAYGTFPWGVLAPIAFASLIAATDANQKRLGAIAFAWAGTAWIATELFQRKVGFTLWAGFPALAVAIGGWIDGALSRSRTTVEPERGMPKGAMLVGLFVGIAILDLGKDLQSFSERLSSILVGNDAIPYPTMSRLGFLPTRLWVLVLGMYVGLGFALAMIAWRDEVVVRTSPPTRRSLLRSLAIAIVIALALPLGILVVVFVRGGGDGAVTLRRDIARVGALVAALGTVAMAAFWAFGWQPALAENLSSKAMFDTFTDLKKPGDALVIMGDLGDAPRDYAPGTTPELATAREQIVASLGRQTRVFAIAPQTELCQLHREVGGKPYFVIDERNVRSLLLSNKVDGKTDKNPLRTAIVHAEPTGIPFRAPGRMVWDGRIQLLGWDMPKTVSRGSKFTVKMFYKVLQPVGGTWKVLFHFDGPLRFNGDHDPINGRCQTSTWQPGDFIIDTYTVMAGGGAFAAGPYEVWTGFFTGTAPNWKNMTVSEAPGDRRDNADRVKITTITLE